MLKILSYEACIKDRTSYQLLKFTHTTIKFSKTACSPRLFTPTFQYFQTDICAISVTFCNSGTILWNLNKCIYAQMRKRKATKL